MICGGGTVCTGILREHTEKRLKQIRQNGLKQLIPKGCSLSQTFELRVCACL